LHPHTPGYPPHGIYDLASEMKAPVPVCKTLSEVPPASHYSSKDAEHQRYYIRHRNEYAALQGNRTRKEVGTEARHSREK
ncbi:asparagine synthase B, partial [Vibrio parahaemolyticus]|nr:asparagine synthase B [Vibrio parahaemolyticus]